MEPFDPDAESAVGYIARLEAAINELQRQLAEVDGLVATHAYRIDSNAPDTWPKGSILAAAVRRHYTRLAVTNG